MSDVVPAWNQALVDEIDTIVADEMPSGEAKYVEGYKWQRHLMWLAGHAILRHYPELRDYEPNPKGGRPKLIEGGGGSISYQAVAEATGYHHNTIKKWVDTAKAGGLTEETFTEYIEPIAALAWDKVIGQYDQDALPPPDVPLPDGKYQVIYCDPPWPVGSMVMEKWESPIEDKYPTMTLEEITEIPVQSIAADDCALFMWTTHTFLHDALHIIEAWGFKYFCLITWDKGGGWTQNGFHKRTELLLYGYSGTMNVEPTGNAIPTIVVEPKGKHSKKPDSIRDMIAAKTPEPRIELFARNLSEGWAVWGNEADG